MLQLQRASAGSGKTEQLARRYLQLFLNPERAHLDPAAVVATTFTREAAGEIVARIFRLLARACKEEACRCILVEGTCFPIPTQKECENLLRRFVNDVDRLSIGTIDALFAQQARVLALDLGMSSPWEVADTVTSEELAREALLATLKEDLSIREAWALLHHGTRVLSFVEKGTSIFEKNRWVARAQPASQEWKIEDRRWKMGASTADQARPSSPDLSSAFQTLNDNSCNATSPISHLPSSFSRADFASTASPQIFSDGEKIKAFLKNFKVPLNSKEKPDSRWIKALEQLKNFFSRPLLVKDLLAGGTLLKNCLSAMPIVQQGVSPVSHDCIYELAGTDALLTEPTFYGKPIPTHFVNFFLPFIQECIQEQQRLEALREEALGRMMRQYESVRQEISFRAGKYTFSEIEEAVQQEHHQLSFDEIALRMDLRTEHLLLDEYQDTSQRQHDFLSPLVGNVLAKGGEVFVVGDVKQGIYGWRGGKRHLLSLLEQEHDVFKKEISPLNQSYRSSRAVLEAVNEVFGALKNEEAMRAMEGGVAFEKAAARWSADFQEHVGSPSVADLKGRVRVHSVTERGDQLEEDPMNNVVEKAVMLVEEHLTEDPAREVAILVRRTKLIAPLLQRLQEKEIIASGEGGNPLTDTLAVELLLSLLTWIDHPGHTAAYEHVFHSALRHLVDQKNAALQLRQKLIDAGVAATLRSWIAQPAFQAACSVYEQSRLEQLMTLAEKWDLSKNGRLSAFVKRIRHERVETPLPANVRVLTFHAAKGLEFESVILMDLDVDITAGGERSLRVQQNEEGRFFIQGNQEKMAMQGRSSLLSALQEEQWAEMLSLLYVGMTRAASYLDLLFFEKPSRKKTMAQWLRASGLQRHEVVGKSLRLLKPITPALPQQRPIQQPSNESYQKFSQRHPSEEQEGGLVSLGQLLQGRSAREKGTTVHAELAQIEWERTAAHELKLKAEAEVFQKEFFLKRWKERGVIQLELWREKRFAVVKEKEFISGIFDRVVLGQNEEGIPIIAEVIDFKTGEKNSDQEKLYEPQFKAYRTALQEMLPSLREVVTRLVWIN
ncbi:MAG: hypothetical protein FJ390_01970 [Verrucomicrobia bacterium]|nr:hypothetical protein [Verrucomicrobiota bacterium]